jgi:hypothetical protein
VYVQRLQFLSAPLRVKFERQVVTIYLVVAYHPLRHRIARICSIGTGSAGAAPKIPNSLLPTQFLKLWRRRDHVETSRPPSAHGEEDSCSPKTEAPVMDTMCLSLVCLRTWLD